MEKEEKRGNKLKANKVSSQPLAFNPARAFPFIIWNLLFINFSIYKRRSDYA